MADSESVEERALPPAPPVIITDPEGRSFYVRQAAALITPEAARTIAQAVVLFIGTALVNSLGYQVVNPNAPMGVVGQTKVSDDAKPSGETSSETTPSDPS